MRIEDDYVLRVSQRPGTPTRYERVATIARGILIVAAVAVTLVLVTRCAPSPASQVDRGQVAPTCEMINATQGFCH